ncbi:phosphate ABC transporter permease subunit PstC [Allonocardiopsis opalescens]|uniref:Phosphate transport system permease protein n=1 Tax=Allonocardiopsis opalescens TaxID=1144618 RepID=A0A2T0QAB4_9ACTN|nr:phosphate ABC transporter permease subunit PstC [Allonocardiopsis opalescens]PRY00787.1 phosphate ABC transporter membrane protein 1 (PhoT family) [Allonocardiopsis opalescens]
MTTTQPPQTEQPAKPPPGRRTRRRPGDLVFENSARLSGVLILVILAAVAVFLLVQALPALSENQGNFLTDTEWAPSGDAPSFGVAALVFGTLLAAVLALVIATPVAVGIALFISHYAPRRLASLLGYVVDLLAAIPSVVYGLWGITWLMPQIGPFFEGLNRYLGFIPIFAGPVASPPRTILTASIVLAVMILPIVTAVAREVFLKTPTMHEEAALALGATRWEMIRMAVLPFGRSGVISAAMLGLGRALGETMAVAMVLSPGLLIDFFLLQAGHHQTIAALIALQFPEASTLQVSALIAAGLVLFAITLVVNMAARYIVSRRKEFTE